MTKRWMKRLQKTALLFAVMIFMTGCGSNPYKEGMENLENGQFKEASEYLKEAVEKEKNLADSYRGLGIALFELEDYEGAKEALENALSEGAKETATIYGLLGNCSMELEKYEEAIQYYHLGIDMDDASDELRRELEYNKIAAYERTGDVESAKAAVLAYLEKYPEDEEVIKESKFLETR